MTLDTLLRQAADGLRAQETTVPPFEGLLLGRRRHRQRIAAATIVVALLFAGTVFAAHRQRNIITASQTPTALLARPLHFPSLQPADSCPASVGAPADTSLSSGVALGSGPVRVVVANAGDLVHGQAELGTTRVPGWFALQTVWFASPGYNGPFVVRGARLGASGPMEVQPGQDGLTPGTGPLTVAAGPTANTKDGYRTVPGSTWVTSPGCYAWQVDGTDFSDVIIVDAVAR